MKFDITKITAIGCNKAFMTIVVNESVFTIRIPEKLYINLRKAGVITGQKLRYANTKIHKNQKN